MRKKLLLGVILSVSAFSFFCVSSVYAAETQRAEQIDLLHALEQCITPNSLSQYEKDKIDGMDRRALEQWLSTQIGISADYLQTKIYLDICKQAPQKCDPQEVNTSLQSLAQLEKDTQLARSRITYIFIRFLKNNWLQDKDYIAWEKLNNGYPLPSCLEW